MDAGSKPHVRLTSGSMPGAQKPLRDGLSYEIYMEFVLILSPSLLFSPLPSFLLSFLPVFSPPLLLLSLCFPLPLYHTCDFICVFYIPSMCIWGYSVSC